MNSYLFAQRLGRLSPQAFQRAQHDRLLRSLEAESDIQFAVTTVAPPETSLPSNNPRNSSSAGQLQGSNPLESREIYAHKAGVNVLAIDRHAGRYLVSGGADSTVRLWDLETPRDSDSNSPTATYTPSASLLRSTPSSHTHAITSLSIYPHDPSPTTVFTTSHDKTLKVSSITPPGITPVHTFPLPSTPHSHSIPISPSSPHPSLIAVGTSHPLIPLIDLRSSLATHSLPGHTSAVLSVCWSPSPSSPHTLAGSSASGAVLFFDIRRANSAFASLDADDAIGVLPPAYTPEYAGRKALDWNVKAHTGPVTGVRWTSSGRHIVTCGHDQRIRVWDAMTGKNELVHFGPRVKNARYGEFCPLLSPAGFDDGVGGSGRGETMLWANDDSRGEIFDYDLYEGTLRRVLKVPGAIRVDSQPAPGKGKGKQAATSQRMTGPGRTNAMVYRVNAGSGSAVEMYSAHSDGKIRAWAAKPHGLDEEDEDENAAEKEREEEARRKRKRDALGELVEGLTKKPVKFT